MLFLCVQQEGWFWRGWTQVLHLGSSRVFNLKDAARKNRLPGVSWSVPFCPRGKSKLLLLSLRSDWPEVVGNSGARLCSSQDRSGPRRQMGKRHFRGLKTLIIA